MLGIREPSVYGNETYESLVNNIRNHCSKIGVEVEFYQSNHEGDLVDRIHKAYADNLDGIVINPGAYTHTSIALLDAVKAVSIPTVEVHISDINRRERFRKISYIGKVAVKTIKGRGFDGYLEAVDFLKNLLETEK
jgi:3-dehydroquinate dehydratase-2